MAELLEPAAVDDALVRLPPWHRRGGEIHARFDAPSFRAAIALVTAIADQAEDMDHHPDIDIRYTAVILTLSTHSAGGITAADVELARRINGVAAAAGARGAG